MYSYEIFNGGYRDIHNDTNKSIERKSLTVTCK